MMAAVELIRRAQAAGSEIVIEGQQLKLVRGNLLPSSLVDELREKKSEILVTLRRDYKAKETWFQTLLTGEVYMRQISDNAFVFVMRSQCGQWDAWRETWSRGQVEDNSYSIRSIASKDITRNATFEMALLKATHYIENLSRWKGEVGVTVNLLGAVKSVGRHQFMHWLTSSQPDE